MFLSINLYIRMISVQRETESMWFGHIVYVTTATESGEKTCNKTVRTEKQ